MGLVLWSHQSFASDPHWFEIRSPNFSVITDADAKRGREVALQFERMRSVFGDLIFKAHVNLSGPLQIVAFRSAEEMSRVAPVFNGKPVEVAGLFQGGEDRSFILFDMAVDNPWSVVFHEYAHQLMDSNLSTHFDPWFEEGFAQYFSSIEVDNRQALVGKIPEDTYRTLRQTGLMPVALLFRVQLDSKIYNESGDRRRMFYAESSLVVHYLYDNSLIPQLAVYFDALLNINQKKTVEEATQRAFGMTPAEFDKVLRSYLDSSHYKCRSIPMTSGIVAAQFTETSMSPADAGVLLADIDAHSPRHRDRALDEFQDVLKMDPGNASALRGTGYVYLQRQDLERAGEYFRRAAERSSKDSRLHYYNALLMNRAGGLAGGVEAGEMKNELETAIALDPTLADAYSLLAYAQAASGEPEKGLTTMKRAVELSPRNETYQIDLANIYLANCKADEAIALLSDLAGSANPEVANHASMLLTEAKKFQEQSTSFLPEIEHRTSEDTAVQDVFGTSRNEIEPEVPGEAPSLSPFMSYRFIKGKLAAVDCSSSPHALLSVVSGGRSLKMHVGDSRHVILIGVDEFSCAWKDQSVAVNYRERQDGDGEVVSLEVR